MVLLRPSLIFTLSFLHTPFSCTVQHILTDTAERRCQKGFPAISPEPGNRTYAYQGVVSWVRIPRSRIVRLFCHSSIVFCGGSGQHCLRWSLSVSSTRLSPSSFRQDRPDWCSSQSSSWSFRL